MRDTQAATRRLKVHPTSSAGLAFVDHHCPHCGTVSRAPLTKLAEGPLGLWCCDGCDHSFAVRVAMAPVEASAKTRPEPRTRTRNVAADTVRRDDALTMVQDHVLALHGEQLLLQSRLHEIAEELQQLQSEPE